MATVSASVAGGNMTVSGAGYTPNAKLTAIASYTATDNKRRTLEMYPCVADGSGAITATVPVRHVSGAATVKVVDASGAVLTTSSGQAV